MKHAQELGRRWALVGLAMLAKLWIEMKIMAILSQLNCSTDGSHKDSSCRVVS